MLYKYNQINKTLTALAEETFKSVNILERQDIESWVVEQPEMLGEDLLILGSEYSEFDKTNERPDVLALDKHGKVVVIELKRDNSGKNAELQAIKYAAYCSTLGYDNVINMRHGYLKKTRSSCDIDCVRSEVNNFVENPEFDIDDKPRVIIVAREFRPEVTATALWLRTFGLDISCLKLTPYRLGGDEIGITVQKLIPIPEAEAYQIRVEMKENANIGMSRMRMEYLDFWTEVKNRTEAELGINLPVPSTDSYYTLPIEFQGIHLEWIFIRRRAFGVEVHFEKPHKDKNIRNLELLLPRLIEFSQTIGIPLHVEKDWTRKWSRIGLRGDRVSMDDDLIEFAVQTMAKLYKFILPILEEQSANLV